MISETDPNDSNLPRRVRTIYSTLKNLDRGDKMKTVRFLNMMVVVAMLLAVFSVNDIPF